MREATGGVQRKVKDVYRMAHYVHCYAHQLNLIMQQATSHITKVGAFSSDLCGFAALFPRSSKRTAVLDKVVAHRLPRASSTRWNFHSRAVNTIFEHKDNLLKCFRTSRENGEFDETTVREAGGFERMLDHVDMLFNQLQKRNIDSVNITGVIQRFTNSIQAIG
jgi:hypothetical protein